MKYLLDTNVIIDHFKGDTKAVSFIQINEQAGLAVSVISVAEVLEGLAGQPKEKQRQEDFEEFLSATRVIDIDAKIAEMFAKMRSNLRKMGKLIDNFDLLIASTALEFKLTLVTDDRDFERINGLKLKPIQ